MPKLQKYLTKDRDISGNKVEYYNYRITVPNDIVIAANISEGQTLYATMTKERIFLHQDKVTDSKSMRVRQRRTRYYRGVPCYVIEIILPVEFIRLLDMQKGQTLLFTIHTDSTISLR